MVNKTKYYGMPDRQTVTTDLDEYINAWRAVAAPIEKAFKMELTGFDPMFQFRRGNPQLITTCVFLDLPGWFAVELSDALTKQQNANRDLKDVMMMVQEQFRINVETMPDTFDARVYDWVDDTVAGHPPNLRG